jgi:signal peptidase II
MSKRKNRVIFFWCIFFGILLCDQGTKFLAEKYLQTRNIDFGKWLSFSLSHNTGCAWNFFQNNAFLLAVLGLLISGIIVWKRDFFGIYRQPIAFGLLLGGIGGNALDRLLRGFVVDFVDVNLQIYRWPSFNIADSALSIAAMILLFSGNNYKKVKKLDRKNESE